MLWEGNPSQLVSTSHWIGLEKGFLVLGQLLKSNQPPPEFFDPCKQAPLQYSPMLDILGVWSTFCLPACRLPDYTPWLQKNLTREPLLRSTLPPIIKAVRLIARFFRSGWDEIKKAAEVVRPWLGSVVCCQFGKPGVNQLSRINSPNHLL